MIVEKYPPYWTNVGKGEYELGMVIVLLKLIFSKEEIPAQDTDTEDVIFREEVIFPVAAIFPEAETLPVEKRCTR